ncbi:hypothetical protein COT57_01285 [Candidatus Micrarchaeota archaeon CG09_land_8_20_14_0_10_55_25]|nr:MAG: hypothetical protein COT57_01285 [Candidatus Micrarchaeota archaeon CG09_land_8_20_14_0_10_55_25]
MVKKSSKRKKKQTKKSKSSDEKYCPSCGEVINKEAEICPGCGVRQKGHARGKKSRVTAGVLAILLGGLGAHKFYLGKTGLGVLYLCFCWTLIPALVGLVEGIIYLTQSDEEFEDKYVK